MNKYIKEYQWSNIFAMIKNLKAEPAVCKEDCAGQLVVITGATSGIGKAAAVKYASHGAELLCINRNEAKSKQLCQMLRDNYGVKCSYFIADFSKLSDVHQAGQKLAAMDQTIDVFIHNAGTFMTQRELTEDNLETVFQTNYLSTFILNHYLLEKFKAQVSGRILFVNSEAHRFAWLGLNLDDLGWENHSYTGGKSYGAAKLAQLLSMIKLDELYAGTGVTINAMHPGNVKTNSGQNNGPLYKFFKRNVIDRSAQEAEISAEALYYLGVSSEVNGVSGKFFNLTTIEEPSPPALDREAAEELWNISMELGELR